MFWTPFEPGGRVTTWLEHVLEFSECQVQLTKEKCEFSVWEVGRPGGCNISFYFHQKRKVFRWSCRGSRIVSRFPSEKLTTWPVWIGLHKGSKLFYLFVHVAASGFVRLMKFSLPLVAFVVGSNLHYHSSQTESSFFPRICNIIVVVQLQFVQAVVGRCLQKHLKWKKS